MSLVGGQFFFWLGFGLVLSLFPFIVCLLLLHFLMPQAVLDRYWKEPHFRPFELMLFSGWSLFAPMRTVMFMWTFMFPRLGKRRGIIEPHRLVPRWYRIAAIVMNVWVMIILAGVLSIAIGSDVYFYAIGDPRASWSDTLLLVLGIGAIAFALLRQRHINRRDDEAKRKRSRHPKNDKPA